MIGNQSVFDMGKLIPNVIECANCKFHQLANIEISIPFDNYFHECIKCGYLITESDWQKS